MIREKAMAKNTTAERHFNAIADGRVTKSNVIGIRKAINHVERIRAGYSGNRSSVTPDEAAWLERALADREPHVVGELHESGLKLLRSPRYRKRWNEAQAGIISRLDHFALVRFDRMGRNGTHAIPVYRAVAATGQSFLFRNIPWQTAYYEGEESGPVVVGEGG
jgi:hypothetical protein